MVLAIVAKLLLVEDDDKLADALIDLWRQERHNADRVPCLADAVLFLERFEYDAIVLDWELPDGQGVTLLKSLASRASKPPVLMLTARSATADKITGLDCGADDYLAKPFEFEELSARLRSLLKRQSKPSLQCTFNEIILEPDSHKAFVSGVQIKVAPRDFQLLKKLVESSSSYVSADLLQQEIFGSQLEDSKNALLCSVSRIRASLKRAGATSTLEFHRNHGYRLNA